MGIYDFKGKVLLIVNGHDEIYPEAMHKRHPDKNDLKKAAAFAKMIVK